MKSLVVAWITALVAFTGIDFVWLSRMGDTFYRPVMGDMVLSGFRLAPAIVFYLVYAAGLTWIAVRPALAEGGWTVALVNGAVLGFVAYATYDLTNQATLRHWSTTLTVVDIAWGTLLSGVAAVVATLVAGRLTQG
jgi:uncharacterized membrane protein